jgi:F-type H+-transporting ATPase subunit alpha
MAICAEQTIDDIRGELAAIVARIDESETGTVLSVGDGIARIHGVEECMAGELLELPHGVMALTLNLEEHEVGAVLMGQGHGTRYRRPSARA